MDTEFIGDYLTSLRNTYPCTVNQTMDLIEGKWKAVILYHLRNEAIAYSDLLTKMPSITKTVLDAKLITLENDGFIVSKPEDADFQSTIHYRLTDFGRTCIPLLESVKDWGYENRLLQEGH